MNQQGPAKVSPTAHLVSATTAVLLLVRLSRLSSIKDVAAGCVTSSSSVPTIEGVAEGAPPVAYKGGYAAVSILVGGVFSSFRGDYSIHQHEA
jgi:hypothetical protein